MTTYNKLSKEHVAFTLACIEKALLEAPTLEAQLELHNRLVKEVMKVSSVLPSLPVEVKKPEQCRRKRPMSSFGEHAPRKVEPVSHCQGGRCEHLPSFSFGDQSPSSGFTWAGFPTPSQCMKEAKPRESRPPCMSGVCGMPRKATPVSNPFSFS